MKNFNFFKYSMQIGIAGVVVSIILFATNWFYELVVPIIENSTLEGATFKFWDDFIFYCPLIFMALFIAYFIIGQIVNKKRMEVAADKEIEENNAKNNKIINELTEKKAWLKRSFHTNCPNCGSPRGEHQTHCSYCGTNLEIFKTFKSKK